VQRKGGNKVIIKKVYRDKRRYFGYIEPKTKYQKRKLDTVYDFLMFCKKQLKIKKLNELRISHIEEYLSIKKYWSEGTKKERRAILRAFYRRNSLE
jgi:hypothetical protein